jgi:hypothetical protein
MESAVMRRSPALKSRRRSRLAAVRSFSESHQPDDRTVTRSVPVVPFLGNRKFVADYL